MLKGYGYNPEQDVLWAGSADGSFAVSWQEFKEIARDVWYDPGYGSQEVAFDLVVVLRDGSWLSRWEYDGAEGWQYNKCPIRRPDARSFSRLAAPLEGYKGLRGMNEGGSK